MINLSFVFLQSSTSPSIQRYVCFHTMCKPLDWSIQLAPITTISKWIVLWLIDMSSNQTFLESIEMVIAVESVPVESCFQAVCKTCSKLTWDVRTVSFELARRWLLTRDCLQGCGKHIDQVSRFMSFGRRVDVFRLDGRRWEVWRRKTSVPV